MGADAQQAVFRVLGPFEVEAGGRPVALNAPKLRGLLALLVSQHGQAVSVARLVECLWGTDPPPDAERTVRAYVSRLRGTLAAAGEPARQLIVTQPPGYALRVRPDALD